MEKQKSIKINFIMNAILTMSTFVFPLITFPYVSRVLLPDGIGRVSFAGSIITYFNMFAQLGIPMYGIRACAEVRDDKKKLTKTAQELLIINLVMSFVSYVLLAIAIAYIPRLQEERTLLIITSSTILLSAIGMEWFYKALEKYTYITVRSIVFKVIALIFMFLLVRKKEDYIIYGAISIMAASASQIFNFANVRKYIDLKPVGNYHFGRHVKAVMVFFAMACAATVYTNLNTVMLGFMKTNKDVGFYSAAVKIKSIAVSIVTSLGTVLLPRLSYYIGHNEVDKFKKTSKKAMNFVFLVATPMATYFMIFADRGIYFLSGEAFAGAIIPMQIIMPTLLLIGITNILGIQILVPLGKEKIVLFSVVAGALVNIVLSVILIPQIAAIGTAIGTLTAEFMVFVYQYFHVKKEIDGLFKGIAYLKILVALIVGVATAFWTSQFQLNDFAMLLISAGLFFGAYVAVLLITREDLIMSIVGQTKKSVLKKLDDWKK